MPLLEQIRHIPRVDQQDRLRRATEIRLRAEIRMGELLAEMEKNKGTRGQLKGEGPGGRTLRPPGDSTPTLQKLNITKSQSSRCQRLAALPKDEQEKKIEAVKRRAFGN